MINEHDIEDMWNDNIPSLNLNNLGPAWAKQEGGTHYKQRGVQPMAYSMANNLDALQHTIVKYVSRFRDKNGIDDLLKARHTLDMLIDWEKALG